MARKRQEIGGVSFLPAEIIFGNKEELKTIAQEVASDVKHLSENLSEDAIKEAKKAVALSRKETAGIESIRKEVKKGIIGNYPEFEQDVKEITSIIDGAERELRDKIKASEEAEQEQKFQSIEHIFLLNGKKYPFIKDGTVTMDKVFNDKWLNKTYTMTKIEGEINSQLLAVQNDLSIISNDPNETRLKAKYLRHLNLSRAMLDLQNELLEEAQASNEPEPEQWESEDELIEKIMTLHVTESQWEQVQIYLKRNGISFETI